MRKRHDLLLRGVVCVCNFTGYAAFVHDDDTVCHAENLGHFLADHDDGFSGCSEFVQQQIDLVLRPDVDAPCGFVE